MGIERTRRDTMVHPILYEGMLTLSSLCLVSIIASKIYRKTLSKILYVDVAKIIKYVDTASVACTFGGVVFLVIAVYSSLLSFTARTQVDSVLFSNQIMLWISAMVLWVVFLGIRAKYGGEIWNNSFNAALYSLAGFTGFFLIMLAGSIRGHLQGQGSILDPIYEVLNINPMQFWAIETIGIYVLMVVSVLASVSFLGIYWKSKVH